MNKRGLRLIVSVSLMFASYAMFYQSSSFLPIDDSESYLPGLIVDHIPKYVRVNTNTVSTVSNVSVYSTSWWRRLIYEFNQFHMDQRYGLFVFV